jgi:hypothetical protein
MSPGGRGPWLARFIHPPVIHRTPRRPPGFRLERMDNELLLYHAAKTTALYLNETATLIWHLCDGQRTETEIANLVSQAFPEAGEDVTADVEATLRRFEEVGAIEFA